MKKPIKERDNLDKRDTFKKKAWAQFQWIGGKKRAKKKKTPCQLGPNTGRKVKPCRVKGTSAACGGPVHDADEQNDGPNRSGQSDLEGQWRGSLSWKGGLSKTVMARNAKGHRCKYGALKSGGDMDGGEVPEGGCTSPAGGLSESNKTNVS